MLPNLLVIGVQKGGTTWLHKVLNCHSEIFMSERKELNFFTTERDNLEEYEANFINSGFAVYRGESTPGYFWSEHASSLDVATRIKLALGNPMMIISFRHPVQRLISAYLHHWKMGRMRGDEKVADILHRHSIGEMGHYRAHAEIWLSLFPRERFIFTTLDDIRARPLSVADHIFSKLHLPSADLDDKAKRPKNVGFDLEERDGFVTVDMDKDFRIRNGIYQRMRADIVAPVISESEIRLLEEKYDNDVAYLEDVVFGRDLGWRGHKPLSFYAS